MAPPSTTSNNDEKQRISDAGSNADLTDAGEHARTVSDGPLGHDLSRLAAEIAGGLEHIPAARGQRPLQMHLDVAAVDHSSDKAQAGHSTGLLAHYLQLAELEQHAQALRTHTNRPLRDKDLEPVMHPQLARMRVAACPQQVQSPEHANSLLSCFPGEPAGRPPPTAAADLDARRRRRNARASMQIPLGDTDLTRFLPYALSTPGIQSVLGSPSLSRESSTNDMADWLRRKGHLLSAAAAPPIDGSDNTNDQDSDALRDQRLHVLEGIHRLLLHQRFICLLAQAMMQFGAPLHHLEDNLSRISRHLRIAATFTTTPGLVMISIEDTATFTSETKIIRCASGYDMHRLDLTDRVVRMVSKDDASVEDGTRRLTEIMSMPPLFAWYWQLIDWGLASWSVCLLAFNGSWIDSLAAFVLGLVVGCLNLLASRLKGYTNLFEASVSILSGFMASVFSRWVCFAAVTLSATVVLLPGLILTTGAIELASRNMHAGTIRVGYALMLAFIIAFGINLGSNIYIELFSTPGRASDMNLAMCSPVSQWWWWLAFPIAILSICLLINVHPRNWPACMLVAGAMFAVFWTLVIHLQLQVIGPVVSAFVLGLVGNIWGKLSHHNAYAIMLPGMMVLVPGSVGVRGFVTMFSGSEAGASTQLVSQMVQTSLSIMVGLFASSFVVYPHGKKRSALITV